MPVGTFGGATTDALSDLIALAFANTGTDGTIPGQAGNDQPTVETLLKERMQDSPGWQSAHGIGFAGLPSNVPLLLGLTATMVEQLTGLPVNDLLDPWLSNPVVANLAAGFGSVFDTLGQFQGALMEFLGNINFLDPDFDPAEAIESFIELMLLPTGLIPELIGGLLPTSIIPGLDASKIISGTLGAGLVQPLIDAVSQGFGGTTGLGFGGLQSFLGGLSFGGISFDDLIALIPGIGGGLTGSTGLGSIFTDWTGLMGSPTGLGSGTPTLPAVGSIPLLGGLFSGSTFLGTLIPGLDASKIITGLFPQSQVADLTTMLGGLGTGSSIINQLLAGVPNLAGSTSGLTGWNDVLTDLFGALGSPTNVGSTGTFTLPGISSIPLLGGLLSGGNILSSIIPSLDASKITSGTFAQSFVTGLVSDLSGKAASTTVTTGFQNMYNAWFGSGATGTTTEVTTTIAAIKATVTGGFTLQTFTSSDASWSVPSSLAEAAEAYAFAIGGGQRGGQGTGAGFISPGQGGTNGGFRSEAIDGSALASTLAITVGAAGATSLAVGGQSKIMSGATTIVASLAGVGAIGTNQGYIETTSTPGDGGDGGNGATGQAGTGNAFATGGAGGAYNGAFSNGSPGQPGGAGQYTTTPLAGGGGGGGGGGHNGSTRSGGAGGNGGFPGGASGGAGSSSGPNPQPGTAGNGLVALMWR
jgi:hypothetical protein